MFIIFLHIVACNENKKEIVSLHPFGLRVDSLNAGPLFFLNKDTGFIASCTLVNVKNIDYHNSTGTLDSKWESVLFKTIDGGKTWTNKFWGEGRIIRIDRFGDSIIALLKNNNHTRVFTSPVNSPDKWKEITSFPRHAFRILADGNQMAVLTKDSLFKTYTFFCFSDNRGKSWSEYYDPIHYPFSSPILKDGKLIYYVRYGENHWHPDSLVVYDIHTHTDQLMLIPKDIEYPELIAFDNGIRLAGIENGNIVVYDFEKYQKFKKLYTYTGSNLSGPIRFYRSNDIDWIFAVEKTWNKLRIIIIRTLDNGKTFKTYHVDYVRNIYLHSFIEQDSLVKAWFYDGKDRLQVFESCYK